MRDSVIDLCQWLTRPRQSGFVSTNCISMSQNYTVKGAPGGGTYQVQMSLQAPIVFPNNNK